jgi:Fic family protein
MEKALWAARVWQNLGRLEINERQRKVIGKLIEKGPGGFEGGLTRRKYVALTRASEATAKRDLAELVSSGVLIPLGGGRSVSYQLNPGMGEVERG